MGGCQSDPPVSVYVDRRQFLSPVETWSQSVARESTPTLRGPAQAQFGREPEIRLLLGRNQSRLEEAEEALKRNREWAFERLLGRLLRQARADVTNQERARLALLGESSRRELQQAYAEARTIFEQTAEPMGWHRFRLASLVGFPDPDPNSKTEEPADRPVTASRVREARALRSQISDLDARYRQQIEALLSRVSANYEAELTALKVEMTRLLDELSQAAEAEAKRLSISGDASLMDDVREWDTRLDAVPQAESRVTWARPASASPSTLAVPGEPPSEEILEAELQLWAAENRYTLASKPGLAPDLTRNFARWRNAWKAGHSKNSRLPSEATSMGRPKSGS